MLDNRVQVFAVGIPFFYTFLSITLELLVLVLYRGLGLFVSYQLLPQFLLSLHLLLLHLTLQVIGILLV